ncbi:hypothetical protein J416_05338 [Gracilibacillus halophilus YIM-C55.5]|uniref:Glycine transporter domain-containing protein n=1 Tax=Gracilibacillus halophilus YIM-C55.5 TaxID=1308866 RepID=N4WSQ9_9BACI|nr:trimeric intracellular cation channel family protein [Gracilibacillus halophilus]ENH97410.1 hypothetical protein J416_05338 [Gracilibacillus halophilus YIM-C55.5]
MSFMTFFVYIGTIAFAISGGLIGIKKQLDVFGVILLGLTTALAGGVIRDIMLGYIPPTNLADPQYFLVSLLSCIMTILFYEKIKRFNNHMVLFDAIGLASFTAVGANAALMQDYTQPFLVISMGLVTGIGGGVLRDVFVKEIPLVFRKEIYGVASITGSIVLLVTYQTIPTVLSLYLCLFTTFVIRMLAVKWQWNIPVVHRKTSQVK